MLKIKLETLLTPSHGATVYVDETWPIDKDGYVLLDEFGGPANKLPRSVKKQCFWGKVPVAYVTRENA